MTRLGTHFVHSQPRNTCLGIIKSDDTAYSYVFISGRCYVTVFDTTQGAIAKIVSSPVDR